MDLRPRPVFENPVTGERVVVLTDAREHPEQVLVSHLFIRPGGRVAAAHVHPTVDERFLVLGGEVGFLIGGRTRTLGAGQGASVAAGVVHDWWQVGETVAEVLVEVIPGVRFSEMVGSMFGLARDGKVNAKGLPDPLQLAVMGHEYGDVIRFTKPPAIVQKLTIPPLAALGRRRGRKPMYPEYLESAATTAPDPAALAHLTADGRLQPLPTGAA
jgi:quercetin dioxygenase-like cupin family protein